MNYALNYRICSDSSRTCIRTNALCPDNKYSSMKIPASAGISISISHLLLTGRFCTILAYGCHYR